MCGGARCCSISCTRVWRMTPWLGNLLPCLVLVLSTPRCHHQSPWCLPMVRGQDRCAFWPVSHAGHVRGDETDRQVQNKMVDAQLDLINIANPGLTNAVPEGPVRHGYASRKRGRPFCLPVSPQTTRDAKLQRIVDALLLKNVDIPRQKYM